ncbi:hypothetical protein HYC85_020037 [Camellia sinensis]|uniref:Agglutinin domain-containing protein n=1 Tax=Camellia sinensis TaxID=4442 RepID=A0A7J7GQB6_CAMSI|nr:hypothetical protein HYC85_020037 [Camellia sinensis]
MKIAEVRRQLQMLAETIYSAGALQLITRRVVWSENHSHNYIHEDVKTHGFLQFSGEEVVSQYTKYQVEMAKCGNGLVHVRCCYNNKYWILPKHIAFKGDNGYYLSATSLETFPYLEFASDDIGDPTVGDVVLTNGDGSIRIKSDHFGKFWRRGSDSRYSDEPHSWKTTGANWIWADSDDTTSDNLDTVFWPIKVANNVAALRNLGNNVFCKGLTADDKTDCLNAAVHTIAKFARLEVEELVISRNIYNVEFRLNHARIYDQSIITMTTGEATNRTETDDTVDVKPAYTETKSSTWNTSVSLNLGAKTTIKTDIPFIVDGKVEVWAEFTGAYT